MGSDQTMDFMAKEGAVAQRWDLRRNNGCTAAGVTSGPSFPWDEDIVTRLVPSFLLYQGNASANMWEFVERLRHLLQD